MRKIYRLSLGRLIEITSFICDVNGAAEFFAADIEILLSNKNYIF